MQTNTLKRGESKGWVKEGTGHALKEYLGKVKMANPNSELGLRNCETNFKIFNKRHCHPETCAEGLGKGRKGRGLDSH